MAKDELVTVGVLIALLQRVPPDAVVFGEFEGQIYPLELDNMRIGMAAPGVKLSTGFLWGPAEPGDADSVVAVLPDVGQSGDVFPRRLGDI